MTQREVLDSLTPEQRQWVYNALNPAEYVRALGFTPFDWQAEMLKSGHKRKVINGARQSGKSTIVSAKPCHIAKH
jgi:hypothetical protein